MVQDDFRDMSGVVGREVGEQARQGFVNIKTGVLSLGPRKGFNRGRT